MSQAKVDRYKEEKKNREKIMKKQKMEWLLTKIGLCIFGVAVLGWAGFSVYQSMTAEPQSAVELENYTVDTGALDEYLNGLTQE